MVVLVISLEEFIGCVPQCDKAKCGHCEASPLRAYCNKCAAKECASCNLCKAIAEEFLGWKKIKGEYKTPQSNLTAVDIKTMMRALKEYSSTANNKGLQQLVDTKKQWKLLKNEVDGYSILSVFLADDDLEEVTVTGVNAPVRVYHRSKGWMDTDLCFTREDKIREVINKMALSCNKRITLREPNLDVSLTDGSRLHAAIPPIAVEPCLTIRKFREKAFSTRELVENKTISLEALEFLEKCIREGENIIVAGTTGSGKTTTLNCIATFFKPEERIVVVEDTQEVRLEHKHCIRLIAQKESMSQLVKQTLRMRPDRLIVGEVRNEKDVAALFDSLLSGQGKSALATFHASSAEDALKRFRGLGVNEQDLTALNILVVQKRFEENNKEIRRITEIARVLRKNDEIVVEKLFEYSDNVLKKVGESNEVSVGVRS